MSKSIRKERSRGRRVPVKAKSAAKPRTIHQLRADERRHIAQRVQALAEDLDRYIAEGWRADTAFALQVITSRGHEFVRACAYASILRGSVGPLKAELYT